MLIIGRDYHPSVQQIAWADTETGECGEKRLMHSDGEAERFYRELKQKGVQVRVGIEATGHSRWFERLLAELGFELWVGNAAEIRAARVRKQRNDRRDAKHVLKLLMEDRFPKIWRPSPENRDVRQLLLHRHRLVGMRTRVMNQLQAIAMNEGLRRKSGLWSKKGRARLESLSLAPWTSRRRQELLELLDRLNPMIDELGKAIEQEAARRSEVQLQVVLEPGREFSQSVTLKVGAIKEEVEVVAEGTSPVGTSGNATRIRVGGDIQAPKLLNKVQPVYPAAAKASGAEGTVILHAVVGMEGNPLSLRGKHPSQPRTRACRCRSRQQMALQPHASQWQSDRS